MNAAALAHLCDLGLSVVALCGPQCPGGPQHFSHPTDQSGKIPLRGGWQRSGYRPAAQLAAEYRDGCNVGVLCGLQDGAPLSVVAVDGDSAEAMEWMRRHLPPTPWRTRTRRGEHWYYRARGPVRNRNLRHCTPSLELEIIGNGRQVVGPGSVHASGHTYAEVEPWTAAGAAALPEFDPAWFAGFTAGAPAAAPQSPGKAPGTAGGVVGPVSLPEGGSWPGERVFTRAEFARSFERALAYLSSPRCPPSVSGRDGHGALYSAAVKALRGFPLASWERMASMPGDEAFTVEPEDAMHAAFQLLSGVYNPRCLAADGQTPYPWSAAELWHKVESAAAADRLPGPDYWLYDAPPRGRAPELWEVATPENEEPPTAATVEGSDETITDSNEKVLHTMSHVNPPASSAAFPSLEELCDLIGVRLTPPMADEPEPPAQTPAPESPTPAPAPIPAPARPAFEADDEPAEEQPAEEEQPVETQPAETAEIEIEIDHDTERMKTEAMQALAAMPGVYVRDMTLTDMVQASGKDRHGQPKRPWVRKTGKVWLKSKMNSAAFWYKVQKTKDGNEYKVRERADTETVGAILAAGEWPGVPRLEGIVYTPIVRRNGTILQEPGYDKKTGLYYHDELKDKRKVIVNPTREQVKMAREYLLSVIDDFPFVDRRLAQAVWLSAVLTRFCRFSYSGLAPMFAVNARESGSGKTLLADCAAIIADGRPADMLPFTGDEDEAKREILSLLGRDETHSICLDNLKVPLKGAAFEAMLTGSSTVGREVGSSDVKRIVMSDAVWWATGNDLEIGADMSRRVLLIEIYDKSGKPADRPRKHADLRGYCRRDRAKLVRAALTILAGYTAAGAPEATRDCDGVAMGEFASFESWGRVVRQAVVWAGDLPDPCRAMATATAAATEGTRAGHLVEHWVAAFGADPIQTSEACRRLKTDPAKYAALITYLADHGCTDPKPVSLGMFLKSNMKGVYTAADGKKYILCRKETAKGVVWSVRTEA